MLAKNMLSILTGCQKNTKKMPTLGESSAVELKISHAFCPPLPIHSLFDRYEASMFQTYCWHGLQRGDLELCAAQHFDGTPFASDNCLTFCHEGFAFLVWQVTASKSSVEIVCVCVCVLNTSGWLNETTSKQFGLEHLRLHRFFAVRQCEWPSTVSPCDVFSTLPDIIPFLNKHWLSLFYVSTCSWNGPQKSETLSRHLLPPTKILTQSLWRGLLRKKSPARPNQHALRQAQFFHVWWCLPRFYV